MNTKVLFAVFKRNFVSYFANPTGYVFICVFVLLSAVATFWPSEFFNNNLANLDQLSYYFPLIMLIFIPSITMGIWADERRQGTDELLLTIPGGDSDIVLGKFLAALAILTVSLLYSLVYNYLELRWLGKPDLGLFLGTYFGYWLIGMAMLAIGMVASFLTGNLTVSYIFGALFNAPLVIAGFVGSLLPWPAVSAVCRQISIGGQLSEFSRGVVGLAGVVYFVVIAAMMLYLCMILIGRRHWCSGLRSMPMASHYFFRILALAVIAVGLSVLVGRTNARFDATAEKINSLTQGSFDLLDKMEFKNPVRIEAFISKNVPESYVQTRLNLLSALRELASHKKDKIFLEIHDTDPLTEEASLAKKNYDIDATEVPVKEKGINTVKKIYMNVVVSSGLQSVRPIFIDTGVPIEYELIRSLGTMSDLKKKRIGVLTTDAQVMSRANPMSMGQPPSPSWLVVAELKKQYDVIPIDAKMLAKDEKDFVKAAFDIDPTDEEKMIAKGMELLKIDAEDRRKMPPAQIEACKAKVLEEAKNLVQIDALLAVQPSTLAPEDMERFVAAVGKGIPTAIFEDPMPAMVRGVPGTSPSWPKPTPGGMQAMMMGMRGSPKGDIKPLWDLIGAEVPGDDIIGQTYNPYPKVPLLNRGFVFIDQGEFKNKSPDGAKLDEKKKAKESNDLDSLAFNPNNNISAGLQQLIFAMPGSVVERYLPDVETSPLAITGFDTGYNKLSDLLEMGPMGPISEKPSAARRNSAESYVMAAEIKGKGDKPKSDEKKTENDGKEPAKTEIQRKDVHVVLVSDIDCMADPIFMIREKGRDNPMLDIKFDFDNVPFILNILDKLTGDTRFIEVRKHRPLYRTLERIEKETSEAKKNVDRLRENAQKELEKMKTELEAEVSKKAQELQKGQEDDRDYAGQIIMALKQAEQKMQRKLETQQRVYERQIDEAEKNEQDNLNRVQLLYKLFSVILPPILPLLVALCVFIYRARREREGIASSRLR